MIMSDTFDDFLKTAPAAIAAFLKRPGSSGATSTGITMWLLPLDEIEISISERKALSSFEPKDFRAGLTKSSLSRNAFAILSRDNSSDTTIFRGGLY